jgi:hypothetical protein
MRDERLLQKAFVFLVLLGACSAQPNVDVDVGSADPSPRVHGSGSLLPGAMNPASADGRPACSSGPNDDQDHDGYTVAQGDCNDCDAHINPGAYDVPGNGVDEDCSGRADDEPTACEGSTADDATADDASAGARALGLCRSSTADGRTWGVLTARWAFPDGSTASLTPAQMGSLFGQGRCVSGGGGEGSPPHPRSHSILASFGPHVTPRDGQTMLALSSGVARAEAVDGSPQRAHMCTRSKTPDGFPISSAAACPNQHIADTSDANDGVALELEIRAPSNAYGFSFDFDFYTYEYPQYVCSRFNDFFVALLDSRHPSTPANKDISFDKRGNPVSVNNAFVEVCSPGVAGGKTFACPLGRTELQGTGFDTPANSAATGWLRTHAQIVPGETFKLRLAVWDMGDEVLDTTVLVDNFQWVVEPGQATSGTERVY